MEKKAKYVYFIFAGLMLFVAIFWLLALMATGVFQQDKIIFEGYRLTLSGKQPTPSQTSPYALLLVIGSFIVTSLCLIFEAIGKPKLSMLFIGLVFALLGLFFIILIKLSNILAVLIAALFVVCGLVIIYRFVRDLVYNKK